MQNLKSLFSGKGQTNEADNSVESVAFPKEQEEIISSRRAFMNERIQKAEASKEIDEETQNQASTESPRMAMMRRNMEKNNARENVISTSQKKGKSR